MNGAKSVRRTARELLRTGPVIPAPIDQRQIVFGFQFWSLTNDPLQHFRPNWTERKDQGRRREFAFSNKLRYFKVCPDRHRRGRPAPLSTLERGLACPPKPWRRWGVRTFQISHPIKYLSISRSTIQHLSAFRSPIPKKVPNRPTGDSSPVVFHSG